MKAAFVTVLALGLHASLGHADLSPADLNPDATAVQIPTGATANRPRGANGLLRYNEERGAIEGYVKGHWVTLATENAEEPAPAPAPEEKPTAAHEDAPPAGSHEFTLTNPLADIAKLKDSVTKIEAQAVSEVNKIKAKIAILEKEFASFGARLTKLEASLTK